MNKLKRYVKETPHIRYSNCHEDSDFALQNIKGKPEKILTIASGLDNSLAFLLLEPRSVLAIDSKEAQIYLCNLKKCGIEHLEYEDFLSLLGIGKDNGGQIYSRLRPYLDKETVEYFDSHLFLISEIGIVNCGKFEYYFQFFKKHILSKTHSKKTVEAFMTAESLDDQNEIYRKKYKNLRLRLLFRIFFSKTVMKKLGRDKECFAYAKGGLSAGLKDKFDRCIECNLNRDNPYLQYIIQGKMASLPTYLVKENYLKIKKNIHSLEVRRADFAEVMRENESYDLMYLSDIFEYMSEEETSFLSEDIYRNLNKGGQVLLYNMMIERHLCGKLRETELDQDKNRTFYYRHCYHYIKE